MRAGIFLALSFCAALFLAPAFAAGTSGGADAAIPPGVRVQPAALAAMLHTTNPPIILQVGFKTLYEQAHIPGALYAGPTASSAGVANLENQVLNTARNKTIVIYCGCCPWVHCPNVAAAYLKLRDMGFGDVRVLYLAHNFGEDWADKNYPVERGQ